MTAEGKKIELVVLSSDDDEDSAEEFLEQRKSNSVYSRDENSWDKLSTSSSSSSGSSVNFLGAVENHVTQVENHEHRLYDSSGISEDDHEASSPLDLSVTETQNGLTALTDAVTFSEGENEGGPSLPISVLQPQGTDKSQSDVPDVKPEESKVDLIRTVEKTQCSFCGVDLEPGDGMIVNSCWHNFCMDCIKSAIEQTEASQIRCPFPGEGGCQHYLLDGEVKKLISPEAYQNYLSRSIKAAELQFDDLFRCRGTQCQGIFAIPKEMIEFNCPQCGNTNCIKCKSLKNGGICNCRKRNHLREAPQNEKISKIDPQMKKEWDESWAQMFESVSNVINNNNDTTMPSTSAGSRDALSVMDYLENNKLIKSAMEFTCSICFCSVPPGDGVILKQCTHLFCKDCLAGTIEHCEEPQVKCPYQKDNWTCPEFISEVEIKALVSNEQYEKVLRRSLNQAEMSMKNSFHCKTVNCTAWCEFEEGATDFICCNCEKKNCIKCRAIHESISCQEYQSKLQEDEMDIQTKKVISDLIKAGQAMKCPTCNIIIQKTQGCDGMMCSICKTHICWATKGPRWGPKGKGDRSGGCHCGENKGKRCHRSCLGCH